MELSELKRISFSNPQFADFLDWNSYPQCPGFKSLHRHHDFNNLRDFSLVQEWSRLFYWRGLKSTAADGVGGSNPPDSNTKEHLIAYRNRMDPESKAFEQQYIIQRE
jgi:hypothetical protein